MNPAETKLLAEFSSLRQRLIDLADDEKKRRTIRRILDTSGARLQRILQAVLEAQRKSEEHYRLVVENANEAIVVAQDGFLRFTNPKARELLGYTPEEIAATPFIDFIHPDDRPLVLERYKKRLKGEPLPHVYSFRTVSKDGTVRWLEINAVVFQWEERPATLNFLKDITERKAAEEEREKLIRELQDALAKVKTLSGLIPICASCKKIRDDKGYWNQVEVYIREHSEAQFSHGLCPDCAKRLYPEYYSEEDAAEAALISKA